MSAAQGKCEKCGGENSYSSLQCRVCHGRLPWADAVGASPKANASAAPSPGTWWRRGAAQDADGRADGPGLLGSVKAQAQAKADAVWSKAHRSCARCRRDMGPLESIASARSRGRCAGCRAQVAGVLGGFAREFSRALEAGELSTSKKQSLWEEVARANVPQEEAARFLQASMRRGIEASLKQMKEREDVSPEEGARLRESAVAAGMEPARVERIQARFEQLLGISQIRRGQLPAVVCDLVLEWDEVCHLNVDALYHKSRGRSKSASVVVGRLVATSRAIHFLSDEGGWTIHYRNVLRVTRGLACIGLELSARGGNGTYNVADPLRCQAILTALTRKWKRHITEPPAGSHSRHIPQEVKVAVWQRDGAQCVACGARDYLEFDHIIPHSKGGASTLNNVQLLCRKCNGAKGARI